MSLEQHAVYDGLVVHKRLRPRLHALRYKVFSLLLDVSHLDEAAKRLKLFSHNSLNLVSIHDGDYGDGSPLPDYLRGIAEQSGYGDEIARFRMLCYPRILGYAFNPLTVYFGLDREDRTRLLIYEVSNTFGERKTYVLPAATDTDREIIAQSCRKRFYVSPFNTSEGRYRFHVTAPRDALTVGVALDDGDGPLLKAYFRGTQAPFSDGALLRSLGRTGWMTVKVIAGIHLEAAKLWLKGVRLVRRPPPPKDPITFVDRPNESF